MRAIHIIGILSDFSKGPRSFLTPTLREIEQERKIERESKREREKEIEKDKDKERESE